MDNLTKVGVGVMIIKDESVLLGKRKNSHGSGEYAFPGGHLSYLESFEDCAIRETHEETGIEIQNIRFQLVANTILYKPKHYVHIGLIADWKSGEPEVKEPEKVENWNFYKFSNLPNPLFSLSELALKNYKSKNNFFDKLVY